MCIRDRSRVGALVDEPDAVITANALTSDEPNMVVDLSAAWTEPGGLCMRRFLDGGADALAFCEQVVQSGYHRVPTSEIELCAPISNPEKLICIGLNYSDHAKECGLPLPEKPVVFAKFNNAITGPNADVILPPNSNKIDYEVEMVIVIGKKASCVHEADALDHVVGYTVGNDVSARDWQIEWGGSQWITGKTFDTFAPIGPAIVTKDIAGDVENAGIRCFVNGVPLQNSTTSFLHFKCGHIVSHLSHLMTLQPGDLIFTGTPPGVGLGRNPNVWLQAGDVVVCEIDGLGKITNRCVPKLDAH
eukprot:TRINITY_DN2250_c0_g1_i2.p1 TRINITY_DN2250_c0_g1~~TRINITY_DN2250_c0_g1_i2.p1  ORF type:complete len:303 (-),score=77.32 TRINITY_DN2250_c0_g1_i2:461-1369(-)